MQAAKKPLTESDEFFGCILCDKPTYESAMRALAARGVIYEEIPPLNLKGKNKPIQVFQPGLRRRSEAVLVNTESKSNASTRNSLRNSLRGSIRSTTRGSFTPIRLRANSGNAMEMWTHGDKHAIVRKSESSIPTSDVAHPPLEQKTSLGNIKETDEALGNMARKSVTELVQIMSNIMKLPIAEEEAVGNGQNRYLSGSFMTRDGPGQPTFSKAAAYSDSESVLQYPLSGIDRKGAQNAGTDVRNDRRELGHVVMISGINGVGKSTLLWNAVKAMGAKFNIIPTLPAVRPVAPYVSNPRFQQPIGPRSSLPPVHEVDISSIVVIWAVSIPFELRTKYFIWKQIVFQLTQGLLANGVSQDLANRLERLQERVDTEDLFSHNKEEEKTQSVPQDLTNELEENKNPESVVSEGKMGSENRRQSTSHVITEIEVLKQLLNAVSVEYPVLLVLDGGEWMSERDWELTHSVAKWLWQRREEPETVGTDTQEVGCFYGSHDVSMVITCRPLHIHIYAPLFMKVTDGYNAIRHSRQTHYMEVY